MLTVFEELAKKMSKTEVELMATTCWIVWKARNKPLFEAKKLDPQLSATKAEAVMEAHQKIKVSGLTHRDPRSRNQNVGTPTTELVRGECGCCLKQ